METEYEATFLDIDREDLTERLKSLDARLERPEYVQRRTVLELPEGKRDKDTWLRVRDEGDKITLTLKSVDGKTMTGQKEVLVEVSDFENTLLLLESIGCIRKSYQESRREIWRINDVEIAIDTWPFLDTYVELESTSEESVMKVAELLGFDYGNARFDTVNAIYKEKYGIELREIKEDSLTFDMKNPFI